MSSAPALDARRPVLDRVRARWGHRAIVANLVAQVVIVVTGGAVRLTGSGLGCSTWPQCEPGSFTPQLHDAVSIHPYIEFGNRTLTGVLVVLAAIVAVLVWTDRTRSTGFRRLGLAPIVGVLLQAVIGGITVLVDLHPAVVGGHLLISMALIAVSTWLLVRSRETDGPRRTVVDARTTTLVHVLSALTVLVLALGVVVTGAGPHSGDEEVGYRFAIDPYTMARVHSLSVWLFVATLVALLARLWPGRAAATARPWRAGLVLLGVTLAQGLIGYVQLLTGLPVLVVLAHMLGAALLTVAVVLFLGSLRVRSGADAAA